MVFEEGVGIVVPEIDIPQIFQVLGNLGNILERSKTLAIQVIKPFHNPVV